MSESGGFEEAGFAVTPFHHGFERAVTDLILGIQTGEFGLPITAEDQPDLADIPDFYQSGAGGFWTAWAPGEIVGTIGLRDFGGGRGALRKMFVAAAWRGRGVSSALLATLIGHAREQGIDTILLGTVPALVAAHRFYERNGFAAVAADALPHDFPRMPIDTIFYRLDLAPDADVAVSVRADAVEVAKGLPMAGPG